MRLTSWSTGNLACWASPKQCRCARFGRGACPIRRARDALLVFCYQARKWIGALAAALGGIDVLVFAGGIGENSVQMRAEICESLSHLGIQLDAERNRRGDGMISAQGGRCQVWVIHTDEESLIAREVQRLVGPADGA